MGERTDAVPGVIGGRYRIDGELGRGGMGVVRRARDLVIGRDVAIKQLHLPDGVPPAERAVFQERVLREARTAGRLSDPGAVTVHDVLQEGGGTYIVMELVEAATLSDLIAQRGPMPVERVLDLALRLLSALQAAHAAGIVHRDVKPSNIMISDDVVKLTDFGIAQTLDDPRLTTSGSIIGSPSFMAPERIQGADATPASDLWALGATLFFAAEGWMPFERQSTAATLHAVLNEPPRLARAHGPIAAVITGLLLPDPRRRLTADQVRALLDHRAVGPGRAAQAPTHRVPAAKPRRWAIGAAVAVALFAAGLLLGRFALLPGGPVAEEPALSYGPGGDVEVFELGDVKPCGAGSLVPGGTVPVAAERSCSEPHDFELYASGDPFEGGSSSDVDYPGQEQLTRFGDGMCAAYFATDKIVVPGKDAALRYGALVPTEQAWDLKRRSSLNGDSDDDEGSQVVYCYLRSADGVPLTTSASG
ncbi:serine/threonine-protein kinase [Saccharopolyspora sp. MS10]|uniref:serine/threonine-protein kinase n=1 Tax=Saccharopolyspora sp. MS10 TaxID=3385973 RepID=UPI0039A2C94F